MSTLNITEFDALDKFGRGKEPAVTNSVVSYTTTSESVIFNQRTRWIRVVPDAIAHIRFGVGTVTAVATDSEVTLGEERYYEIVRGAGQHLAVVN